MPYFLILEQATEFPITAEKFAESLTANWQNLKFEDTTSSRFVELSWSID